MSATASLVVVPNLFPFLHGDSLARQPRPTEWTIKGVLEKGTLCQIFGDPGSGKSFVAVDMAMCVATGTPWHGRSVAQGAVFYLAGEGHRGLQRRIAAWGIHHGKEPSYRPIYVSEIPAQLYSHESSLAVARAIEFLTAEYGDEPQLIVVDTVARNFGPANENATEDMSVFISRIDIDLRTRFDCSILLVHHSGHRDKERARGSMALKAALDFEYKITMDAARVIRMENTKVKDYEPPEPFQFNLTTVELPWKDSDGDPVCSAVPASMKWTPPTQSTAPAGKNQALAMEVFEALATEQRKTLDAGGFRDNVVRVSYDDWRRRCDEKGMNRKRFSEVSKSLADKGRVVPDGTNFRTA